MLVLFLDVNHVYTISVFDHRTANIELQYVMLERSKQHCVLIYIFIGLTLLFHMITQLSALLWVAMTFIFTPMVIESVAGFTVRILDLKQKPLLTFF